MSRSRRLVGWYVDSIVIGAMFRIGVWLDAGWWAAVVAAALYVVVPTAVWGRTLGKAAARASRSSTSEPTIHRRG